MKKGVQKIYSEVAHRYELINHILTFGLDYCWRKQAAKEASKNLGNNWLDVCSGTGEMAQNLAKFASLNINITAVDFSFPMMDFAKKKKYRTGVNFAIADAGKLPFPDRSFDMLTISLATRNLNFNQQALLVYFKEFHRVLKPGGVFFNLETSQPQYDWLKKLFHLYVRTVVNPVGSRISSSKSGYKYLAHTIPRFYNPEELSKMLNRAGFQTITYRLFLWGIAALHTATKS